MGLSPLPDAQALAQQVTTALQPYVPILAVEAAEATGKKVPAAIEKVWIFVKDRFAKKPAAEESLKDLLKNPGDPDLQAAVRVQLRKLLDEDAEFATALRPLAETATAPAQTITTTYQADAHGEGIVIAQGGIMEYQTLEESGTFEISYTGRPLDLYTFGVVHINLQDIIDKVALGLLSQAGLLEPTWRRPEYLPRRHYLPFDQAIRVEVDRVQIGSLDESMRFAIVAILADPNVVAVLQNLGANVIWAIASSGIKNVRSMWSSDSPNRYRWFRREQDPVEIGPNLRDVLLALAKNNDGRMAEITFRSKSPNREQREVSIRIDDSVH